MGSRTDRFGFVTFDNDADDLAFHDHQAFVADRVSMDRLLRVACEAHSHTGIVLSEIPPPPPELRVSGTGGNLPPNQPIFYRVAIVDEYGQERVASAPAVAYTAPQVPTPNPPTISSAGGGMLPPGDYQYALSAFTKQADDETALSNITTGSLVAPRSAWKLTPPSLPSGAVGWNVYRKAPTEVGFCRLLSAYDPIVDVLLDDGLTLRGFQRAPNENTTNLTSSITVDLAEPLTANQSCKIYRTFDAGDWEQSLAIWTPVLPYVDQGHPATAGYPPDVSAGVGGAPKIRLDLDTAGTPPPGLLTPTQTIVFNVRGPLETGFSPWQWINELDNFYIQGLRAHLGRGSATTSVIKAVVEARFQSDLAHWVRFTKLGEPLILEIHGSSGRLDFPAGTQPEPLLRPGDGLRVAILQVGDDDQERNLSITVVGVAQHGPIDSSYWSPPTYDLAFLMPTGAPAGAHSEYIDVPETETIIATISWEGMPANSSGFEIYDEANNATYLVVPETSDGSMSAPPEWSLLAGPTRLRIRTLDALEPNAKIIVSVFGEGADVESEAPWSTAYSYALETEWQLFQHNPNPSLAMSTNRQAELSVPESQDQHGPNLTAITLEKDVESGFTGQMWVTYRPFESVACADVAFVCTDPEATIWTGPPIPGPLEVVPGARFTIDIWETSTGQPIAPTISPRLRVTLQFEESLSPPPADWKGMPGYGAPLEEHPL